VSFSPHNRYVPRSSTLAERYSRTYDNCNHNKTYFYFDLLQLARNNTLPVPHLCGFDQFSQQVPNIPSNDKKRVTGQIIIYLYSERKSWKILYLDIDTKIVLKFIIILILNFERTKHVDKID